MQNRLKGRKISLEKKKDGRQLLLTAGLALGVFVFLFLIRDLFPLGDGSVLMIDLHSQYVPLLYRFYDVVTGQKNLFMDLNAAGGAYLYADTINEVLNPFNYILLLFGRDRIYLAVNVLVACYGTAAAVTACRCLQKLWPEKREWNVPLSLCYALSGFLAAQFQIIKWMYLVVLFPLFMLALLRLLCEKKWGMYAFLLGYQLILSLQLGAMTLLFTLFGSGFYMLYIRRDGDDRNAQDPGKVSGKRGRFFGEDSRRAMTALVIGTVTGLLLSMAVLLPNGLQLLNSARSGENLSYFSVMKQHGLDDLFERIYQAANPVLFAMGIVFAWRAWRGKKKCGESADRSGCTRDGRGAACGRTGKYLLAWNAFLWLTVIAQPSNLLWHLGSYMCFPVRYAYMLLLSEVLLVKYLAVSGEKNAEIPETVRMEKMSEMAGEARAAGQASIPGSIALCAAALLLTLHWAEPISQGFSSLAVSTVFSVVWKIVCILALMFGAGVLAVCWGSREYTHDKQCKHSFLCGHCISAQRLVVTVAACVMGGIYFLFVLLPQDYAVRQMNESAYEEMVEAYQTDGADDTKEAVLAENISAAEENSFLHWEDHTGWPLNSVLVSGGRTMTGYFPSGSGKEYAAAMEKLGYLTPWVSTRSWGGTAISDSMLGILREDGNAAEDASDENDLNESVEWENTVWTNGIFLPYSPEKLEAAYGGAQTGSSDTGSLRGTQGSTASAENPLQTQKLLGQILTGQDVLETANLGTFETDAEGNALMELSAESILYLDAGEAAANILVWVNGENVEIPESMSAESPHRILTLGSFPAGTVQVKVTDRSGNALSMDGKRIGILGTEVWESASAGALALENGQLTINDRKGTVTVQLDSVTGSGTLLLPMAYTQGWTVRINGKEAEAAAVFDGFLGVEIAGDESTVDENTGAEDSANAPEYITIEFRFIPPGIRAGLALSMMGILILLAAAVIRRKIQDRENENRKQPLACLYLTVLCLGILLVYIVPNAGLAVNVVLRLLGVEITDSTVAQPAVRIAQIESVEEGIQVDLVEENLMLKKGVRVKADSVENKNFSAELVMDGISDEDANRWSSENNWEDNEHWLLVDFSDEIQIVCVKLFWERTNVCEYAVEYSSDKKEWKTAAAFTEAPADKEQTILLEQPVQARYLRLHVWDVTKEEEDLSLYYQNVSLKELEVYGEIAGNLLIEKPEIGSGSGRVLEIPQVPEGYTLRFGGADYENLIDENGNVADTLSDVETEIGFILEKDGLEWDLPGMKVTIPASEENAGQDLSSDGDTDSSAEEAAEDTVAAAELVPDTVEWRADGGWTSLVGRNVRIAIDVPENVDAQQNGNQTENAELLHQMADLFREELYEYFENSIENAESMDGDVNQNEDMLTAENGVQEIHFLLAAQSENNLGEEGCEIRIAEQEITILANTPQGIRWGCVTLLDLLEDADAALPLGTIRDYPRYEVRGFGIDVGRRAVSLDLLYGIVKELSANKMNTLQIHLNDNQIISQSEYDGTLEGARSLYAGFRLESDMKNAGGVGITSTDLYYTKEEFMQLVADAAVYGVEIVPEIDTPAHSLALTKVFPEFGMTGDPEAADMLDLSKEGARQLGKDLWSEYLTADNAVFAGCKALHLGMDEYFGNAKDYLAYLKELSDYVYSLAPDKELRIWGSLTMKGGDLSGISRDIQMHIWDTTWADPTDMYEEGFSLINSLSSSLYLIPGGGYDWLDVEYLETTWQPNVYETKERTWVIPAWSEQCLGACYMMWNDWASVNGEEITEEGLFERFSEPLPVIAGKLW